MTEKNSILFVHLKQSSQKQHTFCLLYRKTGKSRYQETTQGYLGRHFWWQVKPDRLLVVSQV